MGKGAFDLVTEVRTYIFMAKDSETSEGWMRSIEHNMSFKNQRQMTEREKVDSLAEEVDEDYEQIPVRQKGRAGSVVSSSGTVCFLKHCRFISLVFSPSLVVFVGGSDPLDHDDHYDDCDGHGGGCVEQRWIHAAAGVPGRSRQLWDRRSAGRAGWGKLGVGVAARACSFHRQWFRVRPVCSCKKV